MHIELNIEYIWIFKNKYLKTFIHPSMATHTCFSWILLHVFKISSPKKSLYEISLEEHNKSEPFLVPIQNISVYDAFAIFG